MVTRILAVLNQKGGVGKTTTCVNLGAALARRGLRVLLVDMDPQANLTVHLGLEPSQLQRTTYSLLIGQHGLDEAVQKTGVPGLFVVPSTLALANAEIQLASTVGRELVLREALDEWLHPSPQGADALSAAIGGAGNGASPDAGTSEPEATGPTDGGAADFVLIDCPPSLGTLTMNALCAAGEVLLPIQTEFFALQGVAGILESVRAVQRLNKGLRLSLVVPSLVDRRTTLARDVLSEVRNYFGDVVTKTEIRKNVKLAEAPSHGKTIFEWEPRCNGALDYESLAAEVLGESAPDLSELGPRAAVSTPVGSTVSEECAPDPTEAHSADSEPVATEPVATEPVAAPAPARSSGIGLAPAYDTDADDEDVSDQDQSSNPSPAKVAPGSSSEPSVPSRSVPLAPAVERMPAATPPALDGATGTDRRPAVSAPAADVAESANTRLPADGDPAPASQVTETAPVPGNEETRASWWRSLRRTTLGS